MIAAPPARRPAGVFRLLVVVAALAGLALIQNSQCGARTTMGMPTSMVCASADAHTTMLASADHAVPHLDHHDAGVRPTIVSSAVHGDHSSPAHPAGIAMACLAVFLALLAGLAVRLPAGRVCRSRLPLPVNGLRLRAVLRRPPSLAELCVLRT